MSWYNIPSETLHIQGDGLRVLRFSEDKFPRLLNQAWFIALSVSS